MPNVQGLVYKHRGGRPLSRQKLEFAREAADAGAAQEAGTDLARAVSLIRPATLIGAAARGGAFSQQVIRALVQVGTYLNLGCALSHVVAFFLAAVRALPLSWRAFA